MTECASSSEITLPMGLGATLLLSVECQIGEDHHGEHRSALSQGFDNAGRQMLIGAAWPNLDHRTCKECHAGSKVARKETRDLCPT